MRSHSQRAVQNQTASRGGFTLIEILVVIAILGVVTTLGTSAFVTLTTAWNASRAMADLDAQAASAFRLMRADFADIVSAELSGAAVRGEEGNWKPANNDQLEAYFDRVLEDDIVALPVQSLPANHDRQDFTVVSFSIQREDGKHALVRTIGDVLEDDGLEPQLNLVDPDVAKVIRFRVEYINDEGEWSSGWSEAGHPRAVRVSVTLEPVGQARQHLQISRKAIFPIAVR